ncbi:adenylosuccinate lyase [Candidatus Rariloculus sp.]|uniref:adenylosuccinate lyase n=1 Tax=Candidatus Rariloculus sp. TaxID=3101265 RepID=UPI003D0C3E9F
MDPTTLTALSPLDGRYAAKAGPLRDYLSEYALIRYRTLVEVRWLQHLAGDASIGELEPLKPHVSDAMNALVDEFGLDDARRVKALESTTNHDVKAVEYLVREKLDHVSAGDRNISAFIHFACTSEDINNVAYALMLRDARRQVLLPALEALIADLRTLAHRFADVPMLARTHGQPASPTTLGKEIANFAARLDQQNMRFADAPVFGKFNGAVGNFNAHMAAYPECDWQALSDRFLASLGLESTRYTTQIEPHDWIAEYCQCLLRCNAIVIDLCRDLWGYVSLDYFKLRTIEHETGSSTMPHKVNPIDLENSEGNSGMANAVLGFMAEKLPISRWQRDLTDSTTLRNLAVGLGHSLIAFESCRRGIGKLDFERAAISADLDQAWEVLAEAVQTVMRRHGTADAYEQLKRLTRGQRMTRETLHAFIATLDLPAEVRERLKALTPSDYTGLASVLAKQV